MLYILQGNPRELCRARTGNNSALFWEESKRARQNARNELERQHDDAPIFTGQFPLRLVATFYMPFPATMSHNRKLISENMFHILAPTPDDLLRFVLDIGHGVLYRHPSIIAEMHIRKLCSFDTRTEIEIEEIHNG
jgi:Holliday junction resolvase RusA-like endonuclease